MSGLIAGKYDSEEFSKDVKVYARLLLDLCVRDRDHASAIYEAVEHDALAFAVKMQEEKDFHINASDVAHALGNALLNKVAGRNVYCLYAYWDTEDSAGSQILGVYTEDHLEQARADMMNDVEKLKSRDAADLWESEYSYEDDDSIQLGYDPMVPFCSAVIYRWEITKCEVL